MPEVQAAGQPEPGRDRRLGPRVCEAPLGRDCPGVQQPLRGRDSHEGLA